MTGKTIWTFSRSAALMTILALAAVRAHADPKQAEDIVDHPDKLQFEDLDYQPPKPEAYRHLLDCGAVAYVKENPELPTFDLTVLAKGTKGWNGAEIEQAVISAITDAHAEGREANEDDVFFQIGKLVPLSISMSEQIK